MQTKKADFYKYMALPLRKKLTEASNSTVNGGRDDDAGNWTGCQVGKGKKVGTKFDISACALSSYLKREATWQDFENLTKEKAILIIKSWWDEMGLSNVPDQDVASITFHVRMHYGNTKLVQKALNNLGEKLRVDGVFGPKTLEALIRQTKKNPVATYTAIRNTLKKSYEQANPDYKAAFMRFLTEDFPAKDSKKKDGC